MTGPPAAITAGEGADVGGGAEGVDVDNLARRSCVPKREHVVLRAELHKFTRDALVLGVGALLAVEDHLSRIGAGLALRLDDPIRRRRLLQRPEKLLQRGGVDGAQHSRQSSLIDRAVQSAGRRGRERARGRARRRRRRRVDGRARRHARAR